MQTNRKELERLAQILTQAATSGNPCAPLTETHPGLSLSDAYAISEITLAARLRQGQEVVGKKIGLTSRAVQKQLGVSEPDFGYLTTAMQVPMGENVPFARMIQPRVEGELAFILKKDLEGPHISVEDVIRATDFVLPCIEVIDSRVRDWKIKIQDTVADNASSAFFVCGTNPISLRGVDLRLTGMALRVRGDVRSTGCGAACLDHPALAVAWLANTMAKFGNSLKAGEIILSGAFGPVVPVAKGDHVEIAFAGLGQVHCFFGDQ